MKSDKENNVKRSHFGDVIRSCRVSKNIPLRKVAYHLDIDQAILSKIERGKKQATEEQVIKLADFLEIDEEDLITSWLSDKMLYLIRDRSLALQAIRMAEEKIKNSLGTTE